MIFDFIKLAFINLRHRKLRVWLTMIGIIIGVALVVSLISLGQGLKISIEDQFESLGSDKIFIMPKGVITGQVNSGERLLYVDDAKFIESLNGVKRVSYYSFGTLKFEYKDRVFPITVIGLPLEHRYHDLFIEMDSFLPYKGYDLEKGDSNKLYLGYYFDNKKLLGSNVDVGQKLKVNDVYFKVKGFFGPVGNPNDDSTAIMSFDDFKLLSNSGDRVDTIMVEVENVDEIYTIAALIERRLAGFKGQKKDNVYFDVSTMDEILNSLNVILSIVNGVVFGIAIISLFVGAVGIMNTLYTSVLERTSEIGVMKAIGARNSHILFLFLFESSLMGFVGGVIGILFGLFFAKFIEFVSKFVLGKSLVQAIISFELIFGVLLFSVIVGFVAGLLPSMQAVKKNPVDSLRYE